MRPVALLDRFRRLSPAQRSLVGRALVLVPLVRLALWAVPYGRVRRMMPVSRRDPGAIASSALPRVTACTRPAEIAWAVGTVSRRVPVASCLTPALAAQRLLARDGYPLRLQNGVARNPAWTFEGHAWLAWLARRSRTVIGRVDGLTRFTPMVPERDKS